MENSIQADPLTGEIIESKPEPKPYDLVELEGYGIVRYYPTSGAYMQEQENGKLLIVKSNGNPRFQDPEHAREMQALMLEKRTAAIAQGLLEAGLDMGLAGTPWAVVTEIVRQRAKMATKDNRDGNEAAKFIFSIIRQEQDGSSNEANTIKFQLSEKQMDEVVGKIFKEE